MPGKWHAGRQRRFLQLAAGRSVPLDKAVADYLDARAAGNRAGFLPDHTQSLRSQAFERQGAEKAAEILEIAGGTGISRAWSLLGAFRPDYRGTHVRGSWR